MLSLPKFIKYKCFSDLPVCDINSLKLTAKTLNLTLTNDEFWQFKVSMTYPNFIQSKSPDLTFEEWYHRLSRIGLVYYEGNSDCYQADHTIMVVPGNCHCYYIDVFGSLWRLHHNHMLNKGSIKSSYGYKYSVAKRKNRIGFDTFETELRLVKTEIRDVCITNIGDFILTFKSELYLMNFEGTTQYIMSNVKKIGGNNGLCFFITDTQKLHVYLNPRIKFIADNVIGACVHIKKERTRSVKFNTMNCSSLKIIVCGTILGRNVSNINF